MCLALPGKVLEITQSANALDRSGKIDFSGIVKETSLAYLPEVHVGDYVIVHAGFAISIVQEQEAKEIFEAFKLLEEVEDNEILG